MEMKSPPPACPNTVTVRRNPPRRARPTPYSAAPFSLPPSSSSKSSSAIRSFPIHDILSIQVPDKPNISDSDSDSEKLKVFLRIRPIVTQQKATAKNAAQKNVWPQNPNRKNESSKTNNSKKKKTEICLKVNDSHSVTLCPPQTVAEVRRTKSEVYEGFSYVFSSESSQREVYETMVNPLVDDFFKGKSGMLAAMGPSGSGKTHTMFGTTRDPGMVSRALCRIFSEKKTNGCKCLRTFYLSMFEIYSERGKGEKIMDLSQDGVDLYMQQSAIKGLQEVVISDVQQAESLIASGMLKRSTASTNSNIQSSRSQCIINIRCDYHEDDDAQSSTAILTIVDLAGAEREKKTGNQGARLQESNFINNTSMVFGLCLRSLLEHQKNPKKPFHKHFQNSLLTKYLRDFLEGKKRMALILTAKSGEEDYQDTSYLLRKASPFMNIKFENVEEQPAMTFGNKRRTQTLSKTEQAKRMKLNSSEVCMDDEVKGVIIHQPKKKVLIPEKDPEVETNGSSSESPLVINLDRNEKKSFKENITDSAKIARENQIILNFSRALWKTLKEYKNKLEASENKVDYLNHSLTSEKERCYALETELNLMKSSCSCGKEAITEVSLFEDTGSEAKLTKYSLDSVDVNELNAQVSSSHSDNLEKQITSDTVTTSVTCLPDFSDTVNIQNPFDVQVACSYLGEEHVNTRALPGMKGTRSDKVAASSFVVQLFEEQSDEKNSVTVPCECVVFDKEDLKELEDTTLCNKISGCDTLESAVTDSELLLVGEEISSDVKVDQRKPEEEESNAQVTCSDPSESACFQKQDILDDIVTFDQERSSVEVISISSDRENFVDQSNEKAEVSSPNVVFDKQEVKDDEEGEMNGEITGRDNLKSDVSDSELLVHEENSSSFVKGHQCQHEEEDSNAHVSSSSSSESECFDKEVILDDTGRGSVEVISISTDFENFEVQTYEGVCVSSPNVVCDKEEFKIVEEREGGIEEITGCETLDAGQDSELPCVFVDGVSFSFDKDQPEQEEKEVNVPVSLSDLEESKCIGNTLLLDTTRIFVSSPNITCDKEEVKEVEEKEANGEITDCKTLGLGQDSELPCVAVEVVSTSLDKDQPEQEEEVNVPVSPSNLQGSKFVGDRQFKDTTDAPDQQLVLPKDVIISQERNACKLSEAQTVEASRSNLVKPKRRLRPASSVMLKNINILDFDDANEMPKQHRTRGDKDDAGKKLTQGSSSLVRILKQNLHH